jgi:hypothetical protein
VRCDSRKAGELEEAGGVDRGARAEVANNQDSDAESDAESEEQAPMIGSVRRVA